MFTDTGKASKEDVGLTCYPSSYLLRQLAEGQAARRDGSAGRCLHRAAPPALGARGGAPGTRWRGRPTFPPRGGEGAYRPGVVKLAVAQLLKEKEDFSYVLGGRCPPDGTGGSPSTPGRPSALGFMLMPHGGPCYESLRPASPSRLQDTSTEALPLLRTLPALGRFLEPPGFRWADSDGRKRLRGCTWALCSAQPPGWGR